MPTKAPAADPPTVSADALRVVPTTDVQPSGINRRTDFETDRAELEESIRRRGILQPILVRPRKGRGRGAPFEVVAGERRYRAAVALGLAEIPVVVREDLDDDERAREACAVENLQRRDLSPLEEARTLAELLEAGHRPMEIARRVGKSPQYVARRAAIAALSPKLLAAVEKGKLAWPGELLERLAVLGHDGQREVVRRFEEGYQCRPPTVAELEAVLAEELGVLGRAPFDIADEGLVPKAGACRPCPKHTAAVPELFGELELDDVAKARCTDAKCWASKHQAALLAKLAAARAEHPDLVLIASRSWAEPPRGVKLPKPEWRWEYSSCKKGEKGARAAFVVEGKGLGTLRWIKEDKKGGGGGRRKASAKKPAAKARTPKEELKAKRARLEERRSVVVLKLARELVGATKSLAARDNTDDVEAIARLAFAYAPQVADGWSSAGTRLSRGRGYTPDKLWGEVRKRAVSYLEPAPANRPAAVKEARWLFEVLFPADHVDRWNQILVKAAEEIPKTAAQARLEASMRKGGKTAAPRKKAAHKAARKTKAAKKAPKRKAARKKGRKARAKAGR